MQELSHTPQESMSMLQLVGIVGVVVEVVDGSHCGANAGTNECTSSDVTRTGSNSGTTPGSYRGAGECPTTYHHHGEQ